VGDDAWCRLVRQVNEPEQLPGRSELAARTPLNPPAHVVLVPGAARLRLARIANQCLRAVNEGPNDLFACRAGRHREPSGRYRASGLHGEAAAPIKGCGAERRPRRFRGSADRPGRTHDADTYRRRVHGSRADAAACRRTDVRVGRESRRAAAAVAVDGSDELERVAVGQRCDDAGSCRRSEACAAAAICSASAHSSSACAGSGHCSDSSSADVGPAHLGSVHAAANQSGESSAAEDRPAEVRPAEEPAAIRSDATGSIASRHGAVHHAKDRRVAASSGTGCADEGDRAREGRGGGERAHESRGGGGQVHHAAETGCPGERRPGAEHGGKGGRRQVRATEVGANNRSCFGNAGCRRTVVRTGVEAR